MGLVPNLDGQGQRCGIDYTAPEPVKASWKPPVTPQLYVRDGELRLIEGDEDKIPTLRFNDFSARIGCTTISAEAWQFIHDRWNQRGELIVVRANKLVNKAIVAIVVGGFLSVCGLAMMFSH